MNPIDPAASTMSAGELRDAITSAMDNGSAHERNLHPTKDALIRIGGSYYALDHVAVAFVQGSFVLTLTAGQFLF